MLKGIVGLLGFDFIKNKTVRGVVRVAANVGLALAATTPVGGPILAVMGVSPSPEAGAVLGAAQLIIEAVRGSVKHSKDEPEK